MIRITSSHKLITLFTVCLVFNVISGAIDRQNIRRDYSLNQIKDARQATEGALSNSCNDIYTVVQGDTCAQIAQHFGITLALLIQNNPQLDCDSLQIGTTVCVINTPLHTPTPTPSANSCGNTYTVVPGDSCFYIATNFGITLQQLEDLNPKVNCSLLQVGVSLCLGNNTATTSPIVTGCQQTYVIKQGDTCIKIQAAFNITTVQFQALNPNLNCNTLRVGQQICISFNSPTAPTTTTAAPRAANGASQFGSMMLLLLAIFALI